MRALAPLAYFVGFLVAAVAAGAVGSEAPAKHGGVATAPAGAEQFAPLTRRGGGAASEVEALLRRRTALREELRHLDRQLAGQQQRQQLQQRPRPPLAPPSAQPPPASSNAAALSEIVASVQRSDVAAKAGVLLRTRGTLTLMLLLVVIVMIMMTGLVLYFWCCGMPTLVPNLTEVSDMLRMTPQHEDAGSMVPGMWMVLVKDGFERIKYAAFRTEKEARIFFNNCSPLTSRIIFDNVHHEVEARGPGFDPYTMDTIRTLSRQDSHVMIPGKWMVLVNMSSFGNQIMYFAFNSKANAVIFFNTFNVSPCALFRPHGDAHVEVNTRDNNFLDCRTTRPLKQAGSIRHEAPQQY